MPSSSIRQHQTNPTGLRQSIDTAPPQLTIPIVTAVAGGSVQRGLSAAIAAAAGFDVGEAADKRYSLDVLEKRLVILRENLKNIANMFFGAVIATGVVIGKERFFDTPDFGLEARICAPAVKMEARWVSAKTGQVIPVPNATGPNAVWAQFANIGKKPLENLEVVLEFNTPGAETAIQDQRYSTKPEKGFGRVEIVEDGPNRRRVRIALLNPNDEFEYSASLDRPVTVFAFAKIPGLSFYQVQKPGCGR